MSTEILRYAAFTDRPEGGNPAGVVLDAAGLDDAAMQAIAADVGYSETAFVTGADGSDLDVRYFSPLAEVPFCGHATIATGVAWGDRHGAGRAAADHAGRPRRGRRSPTAVATRSRASRRRAPSWSTPTSTSCSPRCAGTRADLDPALPPRVAYAGAHHPVLAAAASGAARRRSTTTSTASAR